MLLMDDIESFALVIVARLSDELGFEISWEDACVVSFNVSIVAHLLYV